MKDKPNIILIVIDAARADHFSCYGYHKGTTPHIDGIAEEGVLYEQAISPAGWTLPAHTSIFTGLHVSRHGVHNENQVFDDHFATLPEVLKMNGYQTVGICRNDWISEATGLIRGFADFHDLHYDKWKRKIRKFVNSLRVNGKDSWSYEINRTAKQWIRRNHRQAPFFMFVHYSQLHLPYWIPAPYNTKFLPDGMTYEAARNVNQNPKAFYAGEVHMGPEEFEISRALYDCSLSYQDMIVGQFFDFLKKKKILNNTIFIITSDHGESLGDHNHFDHYYVLYDALLRVPLIIRFPEVFAPGVREKAMVQTLDILPTLKELLGLNDPKLNDLQGIPLPPVKGGKATREFTISERFMDLNGLKKSYPDRDLSHLIPFEKDRKIAIRTEKYKLILSENYESELYDLQSDPREEHNIIHVKKHIADELKTKIAGWRKSFTPASNQGKEAEFDEAVRKRLEALGYLG